MNCITYILKINLSSVTALNKDLNLIFKYSPSCLYFILCILKVRRYNIYLNKIFNIVLIINIVSMINFMKIIIT